MREEILKRLQRIEREEKVKILYAVEAGSRVWGLSSENSDYDVRFIYIHPVDWYLSIDQRRDVIEYPIGDRLDISGWDLAKALQLFRKSNPSLMEWLSSPIVYLNEYSVVDRLRKLSKEYFSTKANIYHYLHMAKGNYRKYLADKQVELKKYFYVLRPLLACQWMEKYQSTPPMEFEKLLELECFNQSLSNEIQRLLARKRSGEKLAMEARIEIINDFIEEQLNYYQEYVRGIEDISPIGYDSLNQLFRTTLEEVWR
ncbi:hypothetical protein BX659_11536 [Orenia metallireducens]|uniref:Nucleotidyltransferase n=1 Tax=Orenia metallireducens TaxID=1413210 RepID=A0A285HFD7_9FIRM|nr:nucleotidyltransferase domain-containing protein [Orenia metallireducens]PRX27710.1 hypothetical protein BX659_11536 [Orenia metallireducens]SNY33556.1 hypothetical protein SAMN06265827_11736 [Orenia metallireducens]